MNFSGAGSATTLFDLLKATNSNAEGEAVSNSESGDLAVSGEGNSFAELLGAMEGEDAQSSEALGKETQNLLATSPKKLTVRGDESLGILEKEGIVGDSFVETKQKELGGKIEAMNLNLDQKLQSLIGKAKKAEEGKEQQLSSPQESLNEIKNELVSYGQPDTTLSGEIEADPINRSEKIGLKAKTPELQTIFKNENSKSLAPELAKFPEVKDGKNVAQIFSERPIIASGPRPETKVQGIDLSKMFVTNPGQGVEKTALKDQAGLVINTKEAATEVQNPIGQKIVLPKANINQKMAMFQKQMGEGSGPMIGLKLNKGKAVIGGEEAAINTNKEGENLTSINELKAMLAQESKGQEANLKSNLAANIKTLEVKGQQQQMVDKITQIIAENYTSLDDNQALKIKINDEVLGKYQIKVMNQDDGLKMIVHSKDALGQKFFIQNEGKLLSNLQEVGISIQDFKVTTQSEFSFSKFDSQNGESWAREQAGRYRSEYGSSQDDDRGQSRREEVWEYYKQRYAS